MLPREFPPRSTVYGYFRRFWEQGIWSAIQPTLLGSASPNSAASWRLCSTAARPPSVAPSPEEPEPDGGGDAALIRSLPGMGVVLTDRAGDLSRFRSADALATAGIAPVLRQSGKTRFLRRPTDGDKGLERVFYRSAFCSLGHGGSRAFGVRHGAALRANRRASATRANDTTRPSSPSPEGA